ncbi:hypothetical protein ACFL1B_04160 [Nanoarchaeota archaeon]
MPIMFSKQEGDFPYRADYVDVKLPAGHPASDPGVSSRSAPEYGALVSQVISDIHGHTKPITFKFSEDIDPDLQQVTRIALSTEQSYSVLDRRVQNAIMELSKRGSMLEPHKG